MLEANTGQNQPGPTSVYGNAGSGAYAAPPPPLAPQPPVENPNNNLSTAPGPMGPAAVPQSPATTPGGIPNKPGAGRVNVKDQSRSIGYFLFGASLAAVVVSLAIMAMKAQKAAAIDQLKQQYSSEIQTRLDDKLFKDQEKKVAEIGSQVTLLKTALSDRVIFSKFFTELEKVTYKKAQYTNIGASKEDAVTLSGEVADFVDLSKTIQALKTSTLFTNVDLSSVSIDKEKKIVSFKIQIKLDPSLIKPEGATTAVTASPGATGETTNPTSTPAATPPQGTNGVSNSTGYVPPTTASSTPTTPTPPQ